VGELVGPLAGHAEKVADLGDADEVARLLVHLTDARPSTALRLSRDGAPGGSLYLPPGA
jgi:hypothetical protein